MNKITPGKPRKVSRKMDKEDKSKYFKKVDSKAIKVRMNSQELTLLQSAMRKDGWENISGFIKYKLFGFNSERRFKDLVKRKETDELVIHIRNLVLELADNYIYVRTRYDKDMGQLYKEQGVDVEKWRRATNRWHAELAKRTEEALVDIRLIARNLGLNEYFKMPSDSMHIDWDNHSKEELDALSEQLRKERVAMGRLDEE